MKSKLAISCFLGLVLFGCSTRNPRDEVIRFRERHPKEAAAYYVITPLSPEFLDFAADRHKTTIDSILEGVERRKDSPADLARYLQKQRRVDWALDFKWVDEEVTRELEKGGKLYFFQQRSEGHNATGILVLRDGSIVFRDAAEVWTQVER